MNVAELIKIVVASLILSNVLQVLGAATWVVYACCLGMGLFWIYPKQQEQKAE